MNFTALIIKILLFLGMWAPLRMYAGTQPLLLMSTLQKYHPESQKFPSYIRWQANDLRVYDRPFEEVFGDLNVAHSFFLLPVKLGAPAKRVFASQIQFNTSSEHTLFSGHVVDVKLTLQDKHGKQVCCVFPGALPREERLQQLKFKSGEVFLRPGYGAILTLNFENDQEKAVMEVVYGLP